MIGKRVMMEMVMGIKKWWWDLESGWWKLEEEVVDVVMRFGEIEDGEVGKGWGLLWW